MEVFLRLSSIMFDDDETIFPHKLLLTNRQVSNIRKAFANNSSTDIKLLKTQLSKMIQSIGFLGRLLGPLLKKGLPLTAAASAADAGIHKKILGSGNISSSHNNNNTLLIISNDEAGDIIIIAEFLGDSGLLLKGVTETVKNEVKEQKEGFLSMLLGTLGASLLGNLLACKGVYRAGKGKVIVRAGYGNNSNNKMDF